MVIPKSASMEVMCTEFVDHMPKQSCCMQGYEAVRRLRDSNHSACALVTVDQQGKNQAAALEEVQQICISIMVRAQMLTGVPAAGPWNRHLRI